MADDNQSAPAQADAPIYDISGEKPVFGTVPHEQVQEAITSGKYSFPKGQDVNIVSPDGTFGTVPAHQALEAFKTGYQYATPQMQSSQADQEHYGSLGQQILTGVEGAAQGFAGPAATLAEKAIGVPSQDIEKRAHTNPWTHGLTEAGGFGLGAFTGTGEAALLGKAGEAVSGGMGLMGAGANLATRLASGATRMGTEMALLQAGNEGTKAILQDPSQTVGSAVANVGLSALLGGIGGGALAGISSAVKSGINSTALKEFTDTIAARGAGIHPNELMEKEFNDALTTYHGMNDEILGPQGLKSQALSKLMPEEITPAIQSQIQDIAGKGQEAIRSMVKDEVPERYINKMTKALDSFQEVATNPNASVSDNFDALNNFKQTLQGYSKGNYGAFSIPSYHEAYDFLNTTKNLGRDVRLALEDSGAWGGAADLQKSLNKSWTDVLPAVKDAQGKFMEKIGGEYVPSPQKFSTYFNQNGKATSQTIRQKMMGNFIEGMEKHFNTVDNIYKEAGVENPFPPVGMSALKESLEKPSVGAKLADLWFDKLGSHALGNAAGAAVGNHFFPGMGGAYVGKEILGPAFGSIIQPLLEKGANTAAFQQAMSYGKSVLAGDALLTKSTADLFASGSKTLPAHLYPSKDVLSKLDDKAKKYAQNERAMFNVAGDLGKYLPDHAQAFSQTAMTAVNAINAQRPTNVKANPLDSDIPISQAQKSDFHRKLSIAEQPLLITQHIKDGTLVPQDVQTLKTLYPNYYDKISQQLISAMTDHISNGGTVPYRVRQSLSMFLGHSLDSTMTQQSIQAIQASFGQKSMNAQAGPQGNTKKGTSKLGKLSENMQTSEQARAARANA